MREELVCDVKWRDGDQVKDEEVLVVVAMAVKVVVCLFVDCWLRGE